MKPCSTRAWLLDAVWFLAFAAVSSAWCLSASRELGATFDEPIYVLKGLERWRTGSHTGLMKLGTMPLPVDLDTLPLYLWERWHGFQFDPVADLERLLPYARMGTLVFWWLLFFYGWKLGRFLGGPWAGRLAVAFLACEPSLLAHATLATTDIAVSACLLALCYHFRKGREDENAPWRWRVGVPALWFAAAVLSKASSLMFGPLCLFALEAERLWRAGRFSAHSDRSVWRRFWAPFQLFRHDSWQIFALGMIGVFVYVGSDWRTDPTFIAWARKLPDGPMARAMLWLSEHLCIFSNAGHGLIRQMMHNVRGHGVYLLGHTEPRALWYYFPVALTIKMSVPLLLVPLVLAWLRPRALVNGATVAAALLLLFSLTCRVQIGIRLVLPLVVLGAVGLAAALANALRDLPCVGRRRVLTAAISGGLAWTVFASVHVWPHALCFTNELWGGTQRGYLRLSDSNYDWGQGLKELRAWQEHEGLASIHVWYYGADPALKQPPFQEMALHTYPIYRPDDVPKWVRGRCLAVSTSLLYGMLGDNEALQNASAFLRHRKPVARTMTYFIYDFRYKSVVSSQ